MNSLTRIKSPLSVNLELTAQCNLSCFMCFTHCQEQPPHPPHDRLLAIIDELSKAEVFEAKLFGGEFMVYPRWQKIVEYLVEKGFFLTFVSNGTLFDDQSASFLRSADVRGGGISVHGPPEIHDQITNVEGSFEQAIEGIKACQRQGIQISVLYTLNRQNYRLIPQTIKELTDRGVFEQGGRFTVGRLCPYGQNEEEWEKIKLTFGNYLSVLDTIKCLDETMDIDFLFGDAFPLCQISEQYHPYIAGCWQGTGFAHIDCNGGVKVCAILGQTVDNLLERPLLEIWDQELRKFRSLSWLPEKCLTCPTFCGGGCSASNIHSEAYGPDEFISRGEQNET